MSKVKSSDNKSNQNNKATGRKVKRAQEDGVDSSSHGGKRATATSSNGFSNPMENSDMNSDIERLGMIPPEQKILNRVDTVVQKTFQPIFDLQGISRKDNKPIVHPLKFHTTKGVSIELDDSRQNAKRDQSGLSHGYVFTEKAIKRNHKVLIQIEQVEKGHKNGLAFGVTTCNPATLSPEILPGDSSHLVKMPLYWAGNDSMASRPAAHSVLSFWITDDGDFMFEKNNSGPRTAFLVDDDSLKLYMYFDVYGSTLSIKLIGIVIIPRADLPVGRGNREGSLRRIVSEQPLSIPQRPPANLVTPVMPETTTPNLHMPSIRDSAEASSSATSMTTRSISTNTSTAMATSLVIPTSLPTTPQKTDLGDTTEAVSVTTKYNECSICMDAPPDTASIPCGHLCMCNSCACLQKDSQGICPVCRKEIASIQKIFVC